MQSAPTPLDEAQRLNEVHRLYILDSDPEERFDRITRIVHSLFDVQSVFISLVDHDRVWFKSTYNFEQREEPRDVSFCGHTICNQVTDDITSRLFEVVDAKNDYRFHDNSFIIDTCKAQYYMGFVLQSIDKRNVGTLCMLDSKSRTFSNEEKKLFSDLGLMAEAELNHIGLSSNGEASSHNNISSETDVSDDYTNKYLNLSARLEAIQENLNDSLKRHNSNYNEWCVLNAIICTESASPYLISDKLGVSRPLISKRLETMRIKNLIDRWNSKVGDRRFVHLACTDKGKKIWNKGIEQVNQLSKTYLRDII